MKYPLGTYLFFVLFLAKSISALNGVWRWECQNGYCQKAAITPDTEATAQSLPECRLYCSPVAGLWPKPTGTIHVANKLSKININSIEFSGIPSEKSSSKLALAAFKRFKQQVSDLVPQQSRASVDRGLTIDIYYTIANPDISKLTLDTDESYALTVAETPDAHIQANITADNVFGARHGLETLIQLIFYDDLRDEAKIPTDVQITDKPAYPYRGILLDTARNYVSVDVIKSTLEGMGSSKLNSFHWHITDSHSFPYVSTSLPDLSKYGAYSSKKVYTPQDVADIVEFGLERGIRVIPEFDAPAHVGEGWQNTDFVTCFNAKPWQSFCVEPPCGQFDPTKEKLYDTLETLYGDMLSQFQPDIFHMGGDEVHFGCWNSTPNIVEWMQTEKGWGRSEEDFVKLWDMFQNESLTRLYKVAGEQIPVVLWTSTLTQPQYLEALPKEKYIIQIWTTGTDPQVSNLLNNGYRVILSNYDALYLDCGFAGWVTDGNNWCSPYIGWQKVYSNTPGKIAGDKKQLVLGSEATLWSEQTDSASIDTRLWPRAAAMAEVLWSEPEDGSWRDAETRILAHRERLVERGVRSDALEPEWCLQHEENCPSDGKNNIGDEESTTLSSTTIDQSPTIGQGTGSATKNSFKAIFLILLFFYVSFK